jgi:hypothetical protein
MPRVRGELNFKGKKVWRSKKRFSKTKEFGRGKAIGPKKPKVIVAGAKVYAFSQCLRSAGLKRYVDVSWYDVNYWYREPEERYEFDGEKIIRTVNTFHYISKHTTVNGLCRSFNIGNKILVDKHGITGEEKILGVNDKIHERFKERYYTSEPIEVIDASNSDLDTPMMLTRFSVNEYQYFVIHLKNDFDNKWGPPTLYRGKKFLSTHINRDVKLKMDMLEIIEKLKSGEIKEINHYGKPEIKYTPAEILNLLGIFA